MIHIHQEQSYLCVCRKLNGSTQHPNTLWLSSYRTQAPLASWKYSRPISHNNYSSNRRFGDLLCSHKYTQRRCQVSDYVCFKTIL